MKSLFRLLFSTIIFEIYCQSCVSFDNLSFFLSLLLNVFFFFCLWCWTFSQRCTCVHISFNFLNLVPIRLAGSMLRVSFISHGKFSACLLRPQKMNLKVTLFGRDPQIGFRAWLPFWVPAFTYFSLPEYILKLPGSLVIQKDIFL